MKRTIQKLLSVTFALLLTLSVFNIVPVSANTVDSESDISDYPVPSSIQIDGKEYYQLSNADDLYWFADFVNSGNTEANALLTDDIVINDGTFDKSGNFVPKIYGSNIRTWTPISNENTFNGTFDGQNYTISGIVYDESSSDKQGGLFGYAGKNSVIKNVTIDNSSIVAGGAVCNESKGVISYCTNKATVKGKAGICGYSSGSSSNIINCVNHGTVTGTYNVGGICSGSYDGKIINCYNTGAVTGSENSENVGGIYGGYSFGFFDHTVLIANCYNTGSIYGNVNIGGICGKTFATILNCYNIGSVSSYQSSSYIGGIFGELCNGSINGKNIQGTAKNCFSNINPIGVVCSASISNVSQKDSQAFHSGEVAYLLGQGELTINDITYNGDVWGQDLNNPESYPQLHENPVIISDIDGSYINLHTKDAPVTENEIPPICTEDGSYETVVYCSDCGAEMSRKKVTVPAIGHNYKPISTVAPNCLNDGYTIYKCENCGDTYNSDFVEKLPHNFVNGVCSQCGHFIESKHNYDNNTDESWTISYPYADSISLVFSELTETEADTDFLCLYDFEEKEIGRFSGTELAGQTINIAGDTVTIKFTTDSENTYYGFALTEIIPNYNIILGDVNGDGKIAINDATLLQKYLTDAVELNNAQLKAADVNKNGKITVQDVTEIQKYIANF